MLSITKEQIALLPIVRYDGTVVVVDTPEAADSAARRLMDEEIIGFDTETRPSFKKGHPHTVALLQLSTDTECYLFRLNHIGMRDSIAALLECEKVTKVGLSIKDDVHALNKLRPVKPGQLVELQSFVKNYQIADNSLQKIYGIVFGERISKGQRLTNWEAEKLTESQQAYAALDALACLRLYRHLVAGAFDPIEAARRLETLVPDNNTVESEQ